MELAAQSLQEQLAVLSVPDCEPPPNPMFSDELRRLGLVVSRSFGQDYSQKHPIGHTKTGEASFVTTTEFQILYSALLKNEPCTVKEIPTTQSASVEREILTTDELSLKSSRLIRIASTR